MERVIVGFHTDEVAEWVAELDCGHNQHVRHRPPFQDRHWVVDQAGRDTRIGKPIDCPLCERTEIPDHLRFVRSTPEWNEQSVPAGLLATHKLAEGTWGKIGVAEGSLRFVAETQSEYAVVLGAGNTQGIPPSVAHHIEPLGSVRFRIDFLAVDRSLPEPSDPQPRPVAFEEGGDPACWADRVCPTCGAFLDDEPHQHGPV